MKLDVTTVIVVGVAAYLILRQPQAQPPITYEVPPQEAPRQPGDPPPADAHWIAQVAHGLGTIGQMIASATANLRADKKPAGSDKHEGAGSPEVTSQPASASNHASQEPDLIWA